MDKKKYIQTVTEQIRCKRALPLVTKELEGHIEDQKSDYMKAGMNAEEAEEAAVLEMGDPVEVGVEMDRIHRPKIVLMYLIRTSILADAGNNPGDVEWIASGIGGNINYLKSVMWTIIGLACMIGICYFDYSRIGKYGKLLTGGWIVVMAKKKIWLFRCCKGNTVADTAGVDHLTHSESVHGNQRRSYIYDSVINCSLERMV